MIRAAAALALLAASASAQEHGGSADGPVGEMMAAMDAMMRTMEATELTGQTDADFLLLLIAHHEAAVAMARAEAERGEIAPVRDFARRVVAAQEAEIEEMRQMLVAVLRANPVE